MIVHELRSVVSSCLRVENTSQLLLDSTGTSTGSLNFAWNLRSDREICFFEHSFHCMKELDVET